ncbi:MAG TPA: DUF4233 domain-containing protein [Nocardioidaceae bacterium]|nr:DUF4233 domain-containing protein [Nocardioidaceae bacterium]
MRSAQRSLCAAMLGLQAIVLGLTTPVMISVESVSVGAALGVGLGLTVACVLVAGMLRWSWAYYLGWLIQGASLALGFVVPIMFLLGAIFASLWAGAFILGGKVDWERAEREVLEQEWAAEHGGAPEPGSAEA